MLAHYVLSKYRENQNGEEELHMINTCVSSGFINHMAEIEGLKTTTTLTGFKFIGNVAYDILNSNKSSKNKRVLFGFEESIGYMIDTFAFDKDGITTVAFAACMAIETYNKGFTLKDYLLQLYSKYGFFVNYNGYFICHQKEKIDTIFAKLRNFDKNKPNYPQEINKNKVVGIRDLTVGYDSEQKDGIPLLPIQKNTQLITFKLKTPQKELVEVTLRTSGTEPKIKYYSELIFSNQNNETPENTFNDLQKRIKEVMDPVLDYLIEPQENNLTSSAVN